MATIRRLIPAMTAAIAPGKTALLPGQTGRFANDTS